MTQAMNRSGLVFVSFALAGCSVLHEVREVARPVADGEWTVGLAGESHTHQAAACQSGELQSFFGFDLVTAEGGLLRAAVDPIDGPALRWMEPATGGYAGGQAIWKSADCETLVVGPRPTGWRVNDRLDLDGEIRAHCRNAAGESLEARLDIRHCH